MADTVHKHAYGVKYGHCAMFRNNDKTDYWCTRPEGHVGLHCADGIYWANTTEPSFEDQLFEILRG